MNCHFTKYSLCLVLLSVAGASQAQLVNGNFETGDLTGWTPFLDQPGGEDNGPSVVQFDVAGTGTTSSCAQFEVGEIAGNGAGADGYGEGGGILQDVTLGSGQLTINMDIAGFSPSGDYGNAGNFLFLLDGKIVAAQSLGGIGYRQTDRGTLSYTGEVSAGVHAIAIDVQLGAENAPNISPFQFVDNITLSGSATPEPSTIILLSLGLAGVVPGSLRRRRNGKSLSNHSQPAER